MDTSKLDCFYGLELLNRRSFGNPISVERSDLHQRHRHYWFRDKMGDSS